MKRIFVLLILLASCAAGCMTTNGRTPGPTVPIPSTQNIRNYFPMTQDSTWQYAGEGNEYASFVREVLFVTGDRAQIQEDNGGTVSASVFQVTEGEIIRIYFQGEAYQGENYLDHAPNDSLILLKAPLETGTKWEDQNGVREIVDVNAAVDTPAGLFENCIKVKISSEESTMYEYYQEGVGMVKREFVLLETAITSTLKNYSLAP